jgi:ankyrin repeat protein
MHLASQGDQPTALIFFLDKYNMNINEGDILGSTPLHWAYFISAENAIKILLSRINDLNLMDKQDNTPLHLAIASERTRIIKRLIVTGADITIRNKQRKTPLELAQDRRSDNIIEMLSPKASCKGIFLKPLLPMLRIHILMLYYSLFCI